MTTEGTTSGDLDWLLANMVEKVDHVRQAIILSADGLVLAMSPEITKDDADHLAALAAGMQSLARGASQQLDGGDVRQTVVEMDEALLFIAGAGSGTCLAIAADVEADAGQIAYEMTVLVKRVGKHMVANPR
jgi:predicted regulator of Ras-like GTPase activity (Roadblock/LC7/MglB family)